MRKIETHKLLEEMDFWTAGATHPELGDLQS